MKVLMVGPYPTPGNRISGGVERVIDSLLPEVSKLVDLSLAVPGASIEERAVSEHGVPVYYQKRAPGPGVLSYWTHSATWLAALVDELKPDIVHLQGASGVGRLLKGPRILTIHGIAHQDLLLSKRGNAWGSMAQHGAARIVEVVEKRSRTQIGNTIIINPYVVEALPDVARLRQFPIPNPADNRFMQGAESLAQERPRRIVSVGKIGERKNTFELVQVAARLFQEDAATVTICGQADSEGYLQSCRDVVNSANCADQVEWPGNLATHELIELLDTSSIMLMTSRQETAPMAIAEAHARGVAVVAPHAFGIKSMIEPGKNGFFLPEDRDEQVKVVRAALDHPWDRQAIARHAKATYDASAIAAKTVGAYRSILEMRAAA